LGDKTAVTTGALPPSGTQGTPDPVVLQRALDKLKSYLLTRSEYPGDIHVVVADTLKLMVGNNWSDERLQTAADTLVGYVLTATRTNPALNGAASIVRRVADLWRERMALDYLRGDLPPRIDGNRDDNVVKWIGPHTNEIKGGYSQTHLGHQIFTRLLAATAAKGISPDKAAFLMARLYDASLKTDDIPLWENESYFPGWPYYISQDFRPFLNITSSKAAIDALEASLEGAKSSEDLTKARLLIAAYRDPRYMDHRKPPPK
jgi:hypothetical protein